MAEKTNKKQALKKLAEMGVEFITPDAKKDEFKRISLKGISDKQLEYLIKKFKI